MVAAVVLATVLAASGSLAAALSHRTALSHRPAVSHRTAVSDRTAGSQRTGPWRPPTYAAAAAALPPRPADCIPSPSGPLTEYGFESKITGGTVDLGGGSSSGVSVSVAAIDGEICGIVTPVNGPPSSGCSVEAQLRVPADGVILDPMVATLHVAGMTPQLPFTIQAPPIVDDLGCASSAGGFQVALDAALSGTAGLFGLGCDLHLGVRLAGVLDGPITGMSGTLRSTAYTVDAPPQTVACPGTLPAHITAILGLPLRGNTGVSLPVVATIYQP